jgi:ABC-type Fe3+ transport system permease subunit
MVVVVVVVVMGIISSMQQQQQQQQDGTSKQKKQARERHVRDSSCRPIRVLFVVSGCFWLFLSFFVVVSVISFQLSVCLPKSVKSESEGLMRRWGGETHKLTCFSPGFDISRLLLLLLIVE